MYKEFNIKKLAKHNEKYNDTFWEWIDFDKKKIWDYHYKNNIMNKKKGLWWLKWVNTIKIYSKNRNSKPKKRLKFACFFQINHCIYLSNWGKLTVFV